MPTSPAFYAVIPAGGSGTRLWPLSRAARPKFLLPLTGSADSLLQATMERLTPLTQTGTTLVVTGAAHAPAVARQLPDLPDANILIEPAPRDSCAAIGLAAAVIAHRDPDALMGSFAADHLVRDHLGFIDTVAAAIEGARQGYLMTVGVTPTHPETGYGYLRCAGPIGTGPARLVAQFTEKPDLGLAESYLDSGHHFWNASMFVWQVGAFLAELARQQPAIHAGLVAIADAWDTPARDEVIGGIWPDLPKVSVDYAVMEGAAAAGLVATVPGDFGWHDVGDYRTIGEMLGNADEAGNVVVDVKAESGAAPVLLADTRDPVVIPCSGRLVATLGVTELVIVDTDEALLVCHRDRAQDVKHLVDRLTQRGDTSLT
jgi:mannose-1-phosphate guanylyltransferase